MTPSLPLVPEERIYIPEVPEGTVPLSREYVARGGAPRISRVAPRIFSLAYFERCMACSTCNDHCCSRGVGVGSDNVVKIRSIAHHLAPLVAGPPESWFDDERQEDPDYGEGGFVDTKVVVGGCALLQQNERGCSIHAWALSSGIDYHDYKPLYCSLFPLTTSEGCLIPSIEIDRRSLLCGGPGASIYRGVRHEVLHYFGKELCAELDALEHRELLGA